MQDSVSMTAAGIGSALLPVVKEIAIEVTKTASKMLEWVNANKGLISDKVREFWESLKSGLSIIADVIKFLYDYSAVLEWIIKLWVLYKIVSLAALGGQTLIAGIQWIKYLWMMRDAIGSAIVRTQAWAVAQRVINFLLIANPIGLIIMAIALLGYAIYDLYANWDSYVLKFNISIQDMATGFAYAKLQVYELLNALGIMSDKDLTKVKFEYLENFIKGNKLKLDFLQKDKNLPEIKTPKVEGQEFNIDKQLREMGGVFKKPEITQSETANKREVQTQGQQIAQSINTNKNTSQNITNTQTKEVKIVIDNQNQSNIKLNQAFLNGW
jgi:hypothetical protein